MTNCEMTAYLEKLIKMQDKQPTVGFLNTTFRCREDVRERRKFERFSLRLPTKIEVVSPEQKRDTFELLTSDVSAGGAFFPTNEPLPTNTQVQLRLILLNEMIRELTGAQGCMMLEGVVVRSGPTGMAIYFDENYDAVDTSLHNC